MNDNDAYDEDMIDKFYWGKYVLSVAMGQNNSGVWLNISPGLNGDSESKNSGTFFISEEDVTELIASILVKSEVEPATVIPMIDSGDNVSARLPSVERLLIQKLDMESPYIAGIVALVKSTSSRIEQLEETVNELSRSRERNDVLVEHIRGMVESNRNTHSHYYIEEQEDDTASDHGHTGQRTSES